jgi:drug/metabolite transporter (DMT)-like permease
VTVLVVVLAVVAAFFYACSDFLEQRAASRANPGDDESLPRLRAAAHRIRWTWHRLLRDKVWFAGWAIGTFAYLVQAVALHFGAVSVVQALQVTSLLFTLPLSTYRRPERVGPREWAGGGAVCAGLAVFFLVRGGHQGTGQADRSRMLYLLLALSVAVLVLALLAVLHGGPSRAVLLAVAAGTAFASSASMVKLTTQDLATVGVPGTATDWPGYSLAVTGLVGTVLQQGAFAAGKLPTASTAMIVANPLVGTVFSIYAYGESLPTGVLGLGGLAVAGLLIITGVSVLAHSPLLRADDDPSRAPAASPQTA